MIKALTLLLALALTACANTPSTQSGRIYHYLRTNHDGSLPEHVYVFRETPDRVSVYKTVAPCTRAAYVTGELDVRRRQPLALVGGQLNEAGGQNAFAWLNFNSDEQTLTVRAQLPDRAIEESQHLSALPWMLYDFDLADLTALANGPPPRHNFSFGAALVWTAGGDEGFLREMGLVEAHRLGAERHLGQETVRFDLSGALSGPLWFDAAEGHVIEARLDQPNHAEYQNFQLVLLGVQDGGSATWERLLSTHWLNCPS